MQAAFYTRQGPAPEVFTVGEQPTPQPGPGEVRVRLVASGVNPSDWKVRKGGFGRALAYPLIIPHSDGAGTIDAVGEGVPGARIGERVWTWNAQWNRPFGTAAESVALPSEQAVALPARVNEAEGACIGIPVRTAWQAVHRAQAGPGRTVLVSGGAGSVGHYAIQIARKKGATVIATASTDEKAEHARAAGAHHVVRYRDEDVGTRVQALTQGRGVDAVVEMDYTANLHYYPACVRPGATIVVYGMGSLEANVPTFWFMRNRIRLEHLYVYEMEADERDLCHREIDVLLQAGALRHTIAARLPLTDVAQAHDLVEQGRVLGHVVLDIA